MIDNSFLATLAVKRQSLKSLYFETETYIIMPPPLFGHIDIDLELVEIYIIGHMIEPHTSVIYCIVV